MQIICPKCHFQREISTSKLPANTTHATCPKCSEKFSIFPKDNSNEQVIVKDTQLEKNEERQEKPFLTDSQLEAIKKEITEEERRQQAHSLYEKEQQRAEQNSTQPLFDNENVQYISMVPWEMPGNTLNILQKFFFTILRVLTSAPFFFATMLRNYPMKKALIFYIVLGMIQFAAKMVYFQYSASDLISDNPEMQAFYDVLVDPNTLLIGLLISPFILLLQALVIGLIFQLTVKLIHAQAADYQLIVRIISYSSASSILSIIPVVGDYIYIPWMLFNLTLACRYTLRMSMLKSCLTVLAFSLLAIGVLFLMLPIF